MVNLDEEPGLKMVLNTFAAVAADAGPEDVYVLASLRDNMVRNLRASEYDWTEERIDAVAKVFNDRIAELGGMTVGSLN